jgi:hypothetical protein
MAKNENIFSQLTTLFRSGPVIKRRVKEFVPSQKTTSAFETFRKTQSQVYSTAMSAYGTYDRLARYSDFQEMEYTPEIASALDIYAEETVSPDERGNCLHIYSDNPVIRKLLQELFYDTLNVNFNLTSWVRNMCKYGDFFLFNDVSPEHGVINVYPMPVNEVEREEGFDKDDPLAVRYRWTTQGNQVLENWQVSHFRILGNDAFLPYGSSVLEAARRIWRQLILVEDAMLVYRIVRAPDRRVFYIDVGNVPPEEISNYMEQAQAQLKKNQVVDRTTGRVDLRYNPLSVDEDYFIPVRGSQTGTKIDPLAGGQNAAAIEDVQYIQKKLFAALKIPKAFLGYDEGLGAKATLSQEDIRFSRTIARIQRTIISELNKVAIIHLHCNGFDGEDLLDFDLKLTNPSSIAQQQKLELFTTKFTIASAALQVAGFVDRRWVRKNVFAMQDEEIEAIEKGLIKDKLMDLKVESAKLPEGESADLAGTPASAAETGGPLSEKDSFDQEFDMSNLSINDEYAPIRAQNIVDRFAPKATLTEKTALGPDYAKRELRNKKRRRINKGMSDHSRMASHDTKNQSDSIAHPFGEKQDLINPMKGAHKDLMKFESRIDHYSDTTTAEIDSIVKGLKSKFQSPSRKSEEEGT